MNLLANTGFERDSDGNGLADGWAASGSPVVTLDSSKTHSGSVSQKVVAAPSSSYDIRYQPVPITAGSPYTLSVYGWVTALNSSPAGQAVVKIEWHDPLGALVNYDSITITATDTAFARRAISSTPGTAATSGRVILAIEQGGTVYWDDIQLEPGSSASAYQDGPLTVPPLPVQARRITVSTTAIPVSDPAQSGSLLLVKNLDGSNTVDLGDWTITPGTGFPLAPGVTHSIPVQATERIFAVRSGAADVILAVMRV